MKKILFAVVLSMASVLVFAQDGNNVCVWNAINNYQGGGGAGELSRGQKCADEAAADATTALKGKTWFYRAKLYALIAQDKELGGKQADAAFVSANSLKKLSEVNDPKFKDWEEAVSLMQLLSGLVFNGGVEAYQAKNYAGAYQAFNAAYDLYNALEAKEKKAAVDLGSILGNSALAAEMAGKNDEAIKTYQLLISKDPQAKYYRMISVLYKKMGDKENARKTIDEASAKFPQDINLLLERIDFFIGEGKEGEAIDIIKKAIELDPTNDKLHYALGSAYGKVNKEAEALAAYDKAIEMNPKNFDALFNRGVIVFNSAGKVTEEMNKCGNTKEELAKYEALKKKRVELFMTAKPFFEKAKAIDANDAANNKALKQIELYTAQ